MAIALMGGDGGYVPKRSDLVIKTAPVQKKIFLDKDKLSLGYWDHLGNVSIEPHPGSIRLKVNLKDGHVYCDVADRKITKPTFSFPCGCLFDSSILEFISEGCPVCDRKSVHFVDAGNHR